MGFINSHLTGTWEPGDGDRRLNESPFRVELSGRTAVDVGGTEFQTDGSVIYGLAASRPTAAAAHTAIPFAYYKAADTQVLSQTDGTSWHEI